VFSYIQKWDAKLRDQGRCIALTLDNFSAHYVTDYNPTNILMVFFEPNLTAWIQPLDAGIIRCMKAHYRREQCACALDLDEAGEEEIWDMNQVESMRMAKAAWKSVSPATITNCWRHTGILPPKGGLGPAGEPEVLAGAWEEIFDFINTSMTLPQAEDNLKKRLGSQYVAEQWEVPLKAVMDAEGNVTKALTSVTQLRAAGTINLPISTNPDPASSISILSELQEAEEVLLSRVCTLKERNRLWGDLPTIKDLLEPNGENEVGEDDEPVEVLSDEQIVKHVQQDVAGNDENEDEEDEEGPGGEVQEDNLSIVGMLAMARQLEKGCIGMECELALLLAQTLH
jgi:hypothetical protein